MIAVSFPASPIAVAEMLVHEASHQYFHIVRRAEDVSDPTDARLYYSPIKATQRPLERVLLAFHAFANVVLLHRECVAAGLPDGGYCQRNIDRHRDELAAMCNDLRAQNSLTEAGRLLWMPLAERLSL